MLRSIFAALFSSLSLSVLAFLLKWIAELFSESAKTFHDHMHSHWLPERMGAYPVSKWCIILMQTITWACLFSFQHFGWCCWWTKEFNFLLSSSRFSTEREREKKRTGFFLLEHREWTFILAIDCFRFVVLSLFNVQQIGNNSFSRWCNASPLFLLFYSFVNTSIKISK